MEPYIFFLDIDGTLSTRGEVHPENVRMIKEAQKKGHYVFINTGRCHAYIADAIRNAAPYDGFVCGLGADIRMHGKQIYSKRISPALTEQIVKTFMQLPDVFSVFEGEEHTYYLNDLFVPQGGIKIHSVAELQELSKDMKLSKFTCAPMDLAPLKPFMDDMIPYVHPIYIEFAQKGHNKARGMQIVADKLGVPMERCVAMGDSANDKEMLEAAGIAVVMENGTDDMKKLATFVTANAWEAGVAKAIEKIIGK